MGKDNEIYNQDYLIKKQLNFLKAAFLNKIFYCKKFKYNGFCDGSYETEIFLIKDIHGLHGCLSDVSFTCYNIQNKCEEQYEFETYILYACLNLNIKKYMYCGSSNVYIKFE